MTKRKKMSVEEFNSNYRISVKVRALQDARLINDQSEELEYDSIEEYIENINYVVYGLNGRKILTVETEDDGIFIQALLQQFDIDGLETL